MTIELDEATARWLVTDVGLDAVTRITATLDDGADELTATTAARKRIDDPRRAAAATTAAVARRRARQRWDEADQLLFTRHGLEQASDPSVAAHRARRLAAGGVVDLTAGLGGDAIALARAGAEVIAVERDPARAVLLAHNLYVSRVTARVVVADALHVRVPPGDHALADPARRPTGRATHHLDAHEPPVSTLLERHAERSAGLALELAPGVDRDDPAFGGRDVEVEYVQLGDQLLEATVWLGHLRDGASETSATLLPQGHHRARTARAPQLPVGAPGGFLVEVVPAAVRARLHDELGREVGAWRLAAHRALLTTATPPPPSPWYRTRAIETTLPGRAAAVRRWLRDHDDREVEVVLHGVDGDPTRWWRELGRPSRGPQGRRVELIRRDHDTIAVITDARPHDARP
ncbi:MAG: class I SAM-dependent methyltransferase [Nitriliruptoraceae bacterium]